MFGGPLKDDCLFKCPDEEKRLGITVSECPVFKGFPIKNTCKCHRFRKFVGCSEVSAE